MLFRDLECLELPCYEPEKAVQVLKSVCAIDTPDSVIRQFYLDHRDKEEFIHLYGDLDLDKIKWRLQEFPTEELISIGNAATHPDYVKEETERAKYYESMGNNVIDNRPEVIEHWLENGTWMTPPIFVGGTILNIPKQGLHLVEGHSRVACLAGLAKYKCIEFACSHWVYYGDY